MNKAIGILIVSALTFLPMAFSYADITQTDFSNPDSGGVQGTIMFGLGSNISGTVTAISFYTDNPSNTVGGAWGGGFVTLTQCDNEAKNESSGSGTYCNNRVRHNIGPGYGTISASGNIVTITFSGVTMDSTKYYIFAYYSGSGNLGTMYGSVATTYTPIASYMTIASGAHAGEYTVSPDVFSSLHSPFFVLTGASGGQWAPPPPPPPVIPSIDWTALYFPTVYSTTSAAIAASSTLWGAYATSTVLAPVCNSGSAFSDDVCKITNYLFVPNPEILQSYVQLPFLMQSHFPVSWVASTTASFSGLTASSTKNLIGVNIDFSSNDPASSTSFGNFLPNAQLFATSTVMHFFPQQTWDYLQSLIAYGLWLTLIADIFFYVRNHMHRV